MFWLTVENELLHTANLKTGHVVLLIDVIKRDVRDEENLLELIIEGDDLVEQHQIEVVETIAVFCIETERRLGVFDVVVGKVSDKTACEWRETVYFGTFMCCKQLPYVIFRMPGLNCDITEFQLSIEAGDDSFRVIAEEGVPAELLISGHGLQHVDVARNITEDAQHLDRCADIGEESTVDRVVF